MHEWQYVVNRTVKTEKKTPACWKFSVWLYCALDTMAYILWLALNFHYLKNTTLRFIVIIVFTSLGASVMSLGSYINKINMELVWDTSAGTLNTKKTFEL